MTLGENLVGRWPLASSVSTIATAAALALVLGHQLQVTLALVGVIAAAAIVVARALRTTGVVAEFVTSCTVPVLGLLLVVTPLVAAVELSGFQLDPWAMLPGIALGLLAAIGAAFVFPIATGGFDHRLPQLTYGVSGQLLVPLGGAVLLVYVLDQLRILALLPPVAEMYQLLVTEPAQAGVVASLLISPVLVGTLFGLFGFLCQRPLAYDLLHVEEPEGHLLTVCARWCYRLGAGVIAAGWLLATLVVGASITGITYPSGVQLAIDTGYAMTAHEPLSRVVANALLAFLGVWLLASPLYAIRWAQRRDVIWPIRHVFSGALAIVVGLTVAWYTQQAILASESALQTMDATGDRAWQAYNLLPVIVTGLPFVGTAFLFAGSATYRVLFQRTQTPYALYISYRNGGIAAIAGAIALAVALGTPLGYGLLAIGATLVAWDALEFRYTLAAELPTGRGMATPEFVHVAGTAGVVAGAVIFGYVVHVLVTPLAARGDANVIAALVVLTGGLLLLLALRE